MSERNNEEWIKEEAEGAVEVEVARADDMEVEVGDETATVDDVEAEDVEAAAEEVYGDDAIEVDAVPFDETKEVAQALVKAEEALKEANDRYARTMAEFDNFRKRTLREKADMHERGAKEVLEKLLPVVDNFERAIDHISDDEKDLGITQGVEMIYKQLMGALAEIGVEEIEALDQEFDPDFHHAVSHEDNDEYGENMVQDVFQKGYMYKETVLRHSMVKVVN